MIDRESGDADNLLAPALLKASRLLFNVWLVEHVKIIWSYMQMLAMHLLHCHQLGIPEQVCTMATT